MRAGRLTQGVRRLVVWSWRRFARCLPGWIFPPANEPAKRARGAVGPAARFELFSYAEPDPPDLSPALRPVVADHRRRFAEGRLFGPLGDAASRGATINARIVESGPAHADHFLVVYPEPYPGDDDGA